MTLRHTGSARHENADVAYGNQQFAGTGTTRNCMIGNHWATIREGWRRVGPLKLWCCPACMEARNAKR